MPGIFSSSRASGTFYYTWQSHCPRDSNTRCVLRYWLSSHVSLYTHDGDKGQPGMEQDMKWDLIIICNVVTYTNINIMSWHRHHASPGPGQAWRTGQTQSQQRISLLSPAQLRLTADQDEIKWFWNTKKPSLNPPAEWEVITHRSAHSAREGRGSNSQRVYHEVGLKVIRSQSGQDRIIFSYSLHQNNGRAPAIPRLAGWMKVPGKTLRMCENLWWKLRRFCVPLCGGEASLAGMDRTAAAQLQQGYTGLGTGILVILKYFHIQYYYI